jgi:tetratricopeptide (TPR) repeat protein
MEIDIHKTLEWLDVFIGEQTGGYFNNPTSKEKIEAFEKRAGICLPQSYKLFLQYANGGMIVNASLDAIIKRDKDLATAKWNANYLLSLEELEDEWNIMKDRNFGVSQMDRIYPFIPFCKTTTNEYLVFVNVYDKEIESPVFDAFHEEPPETWGVIANDFNEFLHNYIQSNGFPDVMGDETVGVATDFTGPIEIIHPENETNQVIIERTTNALKYNPNDDSALMERGIALAEEGNLKAALDDFNKCISLVDNHAYYYFNRGDLFMRTGKNRAALVDFDIAVKLEPEDCFYRNCRATVFQLMQKYDEAMKDLNKSLEIDDRNLLAYYLRESIYRTLGEIEKADQDLRKIEEIKEENG